MADILKVTTPMINRYQTVDPKRTVDNIPQFNLQDISRVQKPTAQAELLMQNNGLLEDDHTAALLLELLKDPSVTVGYLKNVNMLKEMINLLPKGDSALTAEFEEMFGQLMLTPEELGEEMLLQEQAATRFQGELFDFFRELLAENPRDLMTQTSVVDVLRAINRYNTQQDVLDALANSLEYLAKNLASSKSLHTQLTELAAKFRAEDAGKNFESLKDEMMSLFKDVEDSILFSPKLAKVLSNAIYNLSRYSGGTEQLQESLDKLMNQLRSLQAQQQFASGIENFVAQSQEEKGEVQSKVLDVLSGIIERQAGTEELMGQNADQMNKIIQSLLSSPSNFTPLLHFVLPVQYQDIQSFLEIWVNPNGEEDDPRASVTERQNCTHMLLVFEVGSLGRFEMELFVRDRTIDLALFCPPAYTPVFSAIQGDLAKTVRSLDYQFGQVRIEDLERTRSLIEVFRALPNRRAGVDVKI